MRNDSVTMMTRAHAFPRSRPTPPITPGRKKSTAIARKMGPTKSRSAVALRVTREEETGQHHDPDSQRDPAHDQIDPREQSDATGHAPVSGIQLNVRYRSANARVRHTAQTMVK